MVGEIWATWFNFYMRSRNFEKRLLASSCLSVRPPSFHPSVPTEQPGAHWTYLNEIWYLNIFRKSEGHIRVY